MHPSDLTPELERAAFDFLYWFARFEFCLKEAGYLKSDKSGKKAEPNWDKFVRTNRARYTFSEAAIALVKADPQQQFNTSKGTLVWREIDFDPNEFELQVVMLLLRAVRNNLFHGGKKSPSRWDDIAHTQAVLRDAKTVLGELAAFARVEQYRRA